ncbi:MAG TPA: glycosyltransferase family A protein [Candidatus Dormibacteraeota bacterium]|nr:glycosyltransferase family A protein [Candidatus Dormibacteraeota bacterium]
MSPPPLFSVVVSTRNQAPTLAATIEAVLAQEVEGGFELIVVNNASTDDTAVVLRGLQERYPDGLLCLGSEVDRGPAGGRNLGLERARGSLFAFTDSDCVPRPGWLEALRAAFDDPRVGIVQGRTTAPPGPVPLFSHHIETLGLDGSFSTSNVAYRTEALGSKRFDPECPYWEDVDLGWRVAGEGWEARFAPEALVWHQLIPLSARAWLLWPRRFSNWPAKAARYPGFRRHLYLGFWVSPIHLYFDLALLGLLLAFLNPAALLLLVPYLVEFARTRSLRGRFPPAKALAHLAWDAVAFAALVAGSVRYRALVL